MQNILIAGFGFMGSTHSQIFSRLKKARVTAIFDTDIAKARALARKVGEKAPIYDDFDRAMAEQPVDVVDICLPVIVHGKYAFKALRAGKHVFCEKPLGMDERESAAMAAAADKAGRVLQVGLCIRFWPEYQALESCVRSRKLGRLIALTLLRRGQKLPDWKVKVMTKGGPGLDTHLHDTDYIHHLIGRPKAVTSVGIPRLGGFAETFTTYHFKDVAVTGYGGHSQPLGAPFFMGFQAIFERGRIEYDSRLRPTLTITEDGKPQRPLRFSAPKVPASRSGVGATSDMAAFYSELSYFIDCLEKGRKPGIATAHQAADSMRTVCAEIRSARTGRTVRL